MKNTTSYAYELFTADERTDYRPVKTKKTRRKRKFFRVVLPLFAVFCAVLLYFQTNVTRALVTVSEAAMRAAAIEAINDAVYQTLGTNDSPSAYEELMKIEKDENGDVVALSANTLKLNKIARDTAALSQETLQNTSSKGVMIPLGALTGIEALSGMGKRIRIDILPVCSVTCNFSSRFESVGINQTKHSVYLNIVADVSIVMAARTDEFCVQTDVLAGECVIVGKIPETYFHGDVFGKNSGL